MTSPKGGGGRCLECERLRVELEVLREENRILRSEVKALQEENCILKQRLDSLESSAVCGGWYKPSIKPSSERKKPGRNRGHAGSGRRRPEHVDKVFNVVAGECPHCNTPLTEPFEFRSRFVWDVPPPSLVHVTEYRLHRYWCPTCRKNVDASCDLLPRFRLGMGVWSWAYVMHHQLNVSFDKIVWWMREVWGLPVSKGALTQGLSSLAGHLKSVYDGMVLDVRSSPYSHVDETGCRVDGVNQWTWVFRTHDAILYHTIDSRGSWVPEGVLGEDYKGVVVSDDYAVYSPLECRKQACWVHLIRKARELTEKKKTHPEHKRLYRSLQRIYHDVKEYHKRYKRKPPPPEERNRHYQRFERRLKRLINREYETEDARRIGERIRRRLPEYLTCIHYPEVPPHNNPGEQALRVPVGHRKTSSLRSDESARTHDILNTLLQTQLQETSNPIQAAHQILQQINHTKLN